MSQLEAFRADLSSVRAARRFVAGQLARTPVDLDVVLLLVSELATNAVCHARTDFTVRVERLASAVRVEVEDASGVPPTLQQVDSEQTSGRGMLLIAGLASSWGIIELPQGKRVWFEHRYG